MTLPIPPSDSFHKFVAIGGLMVLSLSLYAPSQMLFDMRMKLFETAMDIAKLEIEIEDGEIEIKEIESKRRLREMDLSRLEEYAGKNEKKVPIVAWKKALQDLRSEIRQDQSLIEKAQGNDKQIRLLNAQLIVAHEKNSWMIMRIDSIQVIARFTGIIGLILTALGFASWYFKFQIYQDRIIKGQAEEFAKPKSS